MRHTRGEVRKGLLLFSALVGTALAKQPGLQVLPAGGQALNITLKAQDSGQDQGWQGEADIRILNDSAATQAVSLVYLVASSGAVVPVESTADPGNLAAVQVTASEALPATLAPAAVTKPIRLLFQLPPDRAAVAAQTGTLLASGSLSPGLPVTFTLPALPPVVAGPAFSPAAVTINLTKWWPFGGQGGVAEWPRHSLTRTVDAKMMKSQEWLASAQGGRLLISADPLRSTPGQDFSLVTSNVGGAGTYKGDLTLIPGDATRSKLSVTANVQHGIVWPLLTILAGSWAAWKLLRRRELERPRDILLSQIKGIDETYRQAHAEFAAEGIPATYLHDNDFLAPGSPYPVKAGAALITSLPFAAQLYVQVSGAARREDLDAVARKIDGFSTCVGAWKQNQITLHGLGTQFAEVTSFLSAHNFSWSERQFSAVTQVAQDITLKAAPRTSAALAALLAAMQGAANILPLLLRAASTYELAEADYQMLVDQGEQDSVKHLDPRRTFVAAFAQASTVEQLSKGLDELNRVRAELDGLAHPSIFKSDAAVGTEVPEVPAVAVHTREDTRTSQEILARVQRLDRFDFLAAFSLAVATYLVTIYSKGTFGAWHEYLTALSYGVAGTLLVKSASLTPVLPWQQSLRPVASKAS